MAAGTEPSYAGVALAVTGHELTMVSYTSISCDFEWLYSSYKFA